MKICEFRSSHKWELLFRGSETNFNWSKFHSKCDEISPTLVIIRSKDDDVFGGYTKADWSDIYRGEKLVCHVSAKSDSEKIVNLYEEKFKPDPHAFTFMLKWEKSVKEYVDSKCAIYCEKSYGPCFGDFSLFMNDKYQLTLIKQTGFMSRLTNMFFGRRAKLLEPFSIREVEVFHEI